MIYDTDMQLFPPRLPEQPIFYPVLNEPYAKQIANEWNTKSEPYAGFVTQFEVDDNYISQFEIQTVGGSVHKELWIPAEELSDFNAKIKDQIEVIESYFGENYTGFIPEEGEFRHKDAKEQLVILYELLNYNIMDFSGVMQHNLKSIYLNFSFWLKDDCNIVNLNAEKKEKVLTAIITCWERKNLPFMLPKHNLLK